VDRDGGPERDVIPDTRQQGHDVFFDLLSAAATVPALAPPHFGIDPIQIERYASRHSLHQGNLCSAMRLTGRSIIQVCHSDR
jgi:hypothetical protein